MQQTRNNPGAYHYSNARFVDYLGQYIAIAQILLWLFNAGGNNLDGSAFLADYHTNIWRVLIANDKQMRSQAPIDIVLSAIVAETNSGCVGPWGSPFTDDIRIIRSKEAIFLRQMDLPGMVNSYVRKNNFPALSLSSAEFAKLLINYGDCETVMEENKSDAANIINNTARTG